MCTVVILRRPGHAWPLILAANRDEMADRPADGPGRHWPDRPGVVAGRDRLAGGTWFGLNAEGVVAGVLNRPGALGPGAGLRSRGELPLEALDHAEAAVAAEALAAIEPASYRPFNALVADARSAFWLACEGNRVRRGDIGPGLSMLTAHGLNDRGSARTRTYLPRFAAAAEPDPGRGDWSAWAALMADRDHDPDSGSEGAMTIVTEGGFGTVSSLLMALPAPGRGARPVWLFAPGPPDRAAYAPVAL